MPTTGKRVLRAAVVAAGLLVVRRRAIATDFPIPIKVTTVKPGKLFKFVAKGPFTLPDPNSDPTANGGSLCFQGTTGGQTYMLDAASWTALGTKGFRSKGAVCRSVLVKGTVIRGVCKPDTGTFMVPEAGPVDIVLSVGGGTRYCGECGGTPKGNPATLFKAKNCTAPATCNPCAGGGGTTTTTTTTTTTLPCTGTVVGGFCWYASAANASCDDACTAAGRTYDEATRTYAGSDGTDSNCVTVLHALGFIVLEPISDGDCQSGGLGCAVAQAGLLYIPIRCTTPVTTSSASSGSFGRACACH